METKGTPEYTRSQKHIQEVLKHLRDIIRESGMTQLQIQAELGWGKTFLCQALGNKKRLGDADLRRVLDVIGVEPGEFFARVFLTRDVRFDDDLVVREEIVVHNEEALCRDEEALCRDEEALCRDEPLDAFVAENEEDQRESPDQ